MKKAAYIKSIVKLRSVHFARNFLKTYGVEGGWRNRMLWFLWRSSDLDYRNDTQCGNAFVFDRGQVKQEGRGYTLITPHNHTKRDNNATTTSNGVKYNNGKQR